MLKKKSRRTYSTTFQEIYEWNFNYSALPWQFLYFFPLPQGHGSLRPTRGAETIGATGRCGPCGAAAAARCALAPGYASREVWY